MKRKQFIALLFAAMLAVGSLAGCSHEQPVDTKQETLKEEEIKVQEVEVKDLDFLTEKGILVGIEDLKVAEGTNIDLNSLVFVDESIIKSVDIDDSDVDYKKAGEYEVTYSITLDGKELRDYMEENKLTANFDTDGDTVIVQVTVTVTVMNKEKVETAVKDGDKEVITNETKAEVQNTIQAQAVPTAKPSSSPSSGSGSNSTNNNSGSNNTGTNSGNNTNNNSGSSGNNGNSSTTDTNKGNNTNNNNNSGGSGNNNGSSNTDTNKDNGSSNNNNNNNNNTGNSTPAHKHSYTAKVTKAATCGTAGVKTYTCACGDSYTESIPATGNHSWIDDDPVLVIDREWDEDVWKGSYDTWVCNCGEVFYSADELHDHQEKLTLAGDYNHGRSYVKPEGIWETEHKTEWHYEYPKHCSVCGLIK